jgi:hypothetical protein
MNKIILLSITIIVLLFIIAKSNEHFSRCNGKNQIEISPKESYNSVSKGWCKTNISNKQNLQAKTIDELNFCYGETKDEYGNIILSKPKNQNCNINI